VNQIDVRLQEIARDVFGDDSLVLIDFPREQADLLRSAFMGACEGLVRDLILRERYGYPADFSHQQAERFVSRLVDDLMPGT